MSEHNWCTNNDGHAESNSKRKPVLRKTSCYKLNSIGLALNEWSVPYQKKYNRTNLLTLIGGL